MIKTDALAIFEDFLVHGAPRPDSAESYDQYLMRIGVLDTEFRYKEIVDPRQGDKKLPPLKYWKRMAMTLAAVQVLRELWGRPLVIVAAYRPGDVGASNSQHKVNAALDVDYYDDDAAELRSWFAFATKFWCDYGPRCDMGFGLYTAGPKSLGGNRVHIDTKFYDRTWQGVSGGGFQKPWIVEGEHVTLSVKLGHDNGWDVPTKVDY